MGRVFTPILDLDESVAQETFQALRLRLRLGATHFWVHAWRYQCAEC